ncbi:MAG: penicillin-binding protein 1A [Bdellovibrionaceae bacterium]|nr:penicillin-binding protein 1A [Pseudobdellovibrionaceae bacterium]
MSQSSEKTTSLIKEKYLLVRQKLTPDNLPPFFKWLFYFVKNTSRKQRWVTAIGLSLFTVLVLFYVFLQAYLTLPQMIGLEDYKPLEMSQVLDRKNNLVAHFFKQKRVVVPFEDIPEHMIQAVIAAEDAQFFQHSGINYKAIFRALFANIRAGKKVQGASTITQQVARSLLLTREKTYIRKFKEAILAKRMESSLTKENILYLYLNQIYFGQGAYGIKVAARTYFHKDISDISIAEAAILAGLPKAPSAYSPYRHPKKAKNRQTYVLSRMLKEGFITEEQQEKAINEEISIYALKSTNLAPYYVEQLRQVLVKNIGEKALLEQGVSIYTGLDLKAQQSAQKEIQKALKALDKRQGFRGSLSNLQEFAKIKEFLDQQRTDIIYKKTEKKILLPSGEFKPLAELNLQTIENLTSTTPPLPSYLEPEDVLQAVVTDIDDQWGLVKVWVAEAQGIIDIESMKWARVPDPKTFYTLQEIKKPSQALKVGDVILVKIAASVFSSSDLNKKIRKYNDNYYSDQNKPLVFFNTSTKKESVFKKPLEETESLISLHPYNHKNINLKQLTSRFIKVTLEQKTLVQAALLSFDQKTEELIALVGGKNFKTSKFNRSIQAKRQTGSAFKPLVYLSGFDKGYRPNSSLLDAALIFKEATDATEENLEGQNTNATKKINTKENALSATETKDLPEELEEKEAEVWKPKNHSKKFIGDILYRNALIRSMNVPSVRLIEKLGVKWVEKYARRLGIFSPLNSDFTLALGSSAITLYEMTRSFSHIGRLGKRIRPILIHKVLSKQGEILAQNIRITDTLKRYTSHFEQKQESLRLAYLQYQKDKIIYENYQKNQTNTSLKNTDAQKAPQKPQAWVSLETPDGQSFRANLEKEPPLYFKDPNQLLKPTTAYLALSLLKGVVSDPHGTGRRAQILNRPTAGKTGSTNSYYDAWFTGFTNQIATGVWVGFDNEKTLGRGEVGGRAALPIWIGYMMSVHENLPVENFSVPEGIIFINIDNKTGKLATTQSKEVVQQAFLEGTEPKSIGDNWKVNENPTEQDGTEKKSPSALENEEPSSEDSDFFKEELSE